MHAKNKRHHQSTEEYDLDGESTRRNDSSQYFAPSRQSRPYKRQKNEWSGSWRNLKRDDVVKTEKRSVVIDGSNVAFA